MNEEMQETKYTEPTWRLEGECFAAGSGLPEMLAVRDRVMGNVGAVLRHIPGSAFYPPRSVRKAD